MCFNPFHHVHPLLLGVHLSLSEPHSCIYFCSFFGARFGLVRVAAQPAQIFGGTKILVVAKMFDVRRITPFCLGYTAFQSTK